MRLNRTYGNAILGGLPNVQTVVIGKVFDGLNCLDKSKIPIRQFSPIPDRCAKDVAVSKPVVPGNRDCRPDTPFTARTNVRSVPETTPSG